MIEWAIVSAMATRRNPLPHLLGRVVTLILLPGLSGALLLLSFPSFDFSALAWVGFVPLLFALGKSPWRTAFGQGWLAGVVFFSGTLSWVVIAMHQYGHVPLAVSYLVMLLLSSYCALFFGTFAAVLPLVAGKSGWLTVWTAPALWVCLEYVRSHLFSGFPWALLGYSQYHALSVIQIADITGVYGVSFILVLANTVIAKILEAIRSRVLVLATEQPLPLPWVTTTLSVGLFAAVIWYGDWHLAPHRDVVNDPPVRIGLVQANVDQSQKWDVAFRRETIDRYERLTMQLTDHSDLVIWPEASTPFLFEVEVNYRDELLNFVKDHGVPLLFGSPAAMPDKTHNQLRLTNSAFLVGSNGMVLDRYDKIHLVPFGEYIPLKDVFSFLDKMVVGIGDFFPGNGPDVMSGPGGRFGVVICFEVIFPDVVRSFVEQGAQYMVTITNDAWFGRSSAPYQHFAMVVFRAVENRVFFARAANTGISGFIDAQGHILRASDIFVEEALTGEIRAAGPQSLYTAYGDVFAYGCGILTLLALVWRPAPKAPILRRPHAR